MSNATTTTTTITSSNNTNDQRPTSLYAKFNSNPVLNLSITFAVCINFALKNVFFSSSFIKKHMCFVLSPHALAASCWYRLVFCILMSDLVWMAVRIASILCKKRITLCKYWCSAHAIRTPRDSIFNSLCLFLSISRSHHIFKFN